jgi:hypothetical protein
LVEVAVAEEREADFGLAVAEIAGIVASLRGETMPAKPVYCEHGAITATLRSLQRTGLIRLVHFPYDRHSRTKQIAPAALPSAAQWRDANLTWIEAAGLRWSDFVGTPKLPEIASIVGKSNRRDCLHLDSAFRSGCICFVTEDNDILANADALYQLLGMRVFSPTRDAKLLNEFLQSATGA